MRADNNNRARLGTSRSRHDASPGGKKKRLNYFAARRRETNRCSHTCYRSPPSFSPSFVRLLFLGAVSTVARADWSFGIQRSETRDGAGRDGVSSPARSIVAYETRRRGLSTSLADEILASRNERKSCCTRRRRRRGGAVNSRTCARTRGGDAPVCAELVLRIVQNTRNNLWTGHDDDWNIYSARYARCTLYDGIFVAAGAAFRPPLARALRCLTSNTILLRNETGVFFRSERRLLSSAIACDVKPQGSSCLLVR